MAGWTPQTFDIKTINGNTRFNNGDAVQAETINKIVEASALVGIATKIEVNNTYYSLKTTRDQNATGEDGVITFILE